MPDRFHLVDTEKSDDDFPGWLEGIRRRVEEETGRTSPEDRAAESDCRSYRSRAANWEVVMAYLSGKNKHLKLLLQNRSFRECAFDGF